MRRIARKAAQFYIKDVVTEGPPNISEFIDEVCVMERLDIESHARGKIDQIAIGYLQKIFKQVHIL